MPPLLLIFLILFLVVLVAAIVLAVLAVRRSRVLGAAPKDRLSLAPVGEMLCSHAAESLSHVVRFETVTPDANQTDLDAFHRFHRYLELRYPHVHQTLERLIQPDGSLIYHWKSPKPSWGPVLFCAHQDVVPANESYWQYDPFAGQIQDGFVYGRGTLDCKNVIIALFESLEAMCSVGFYPSRDFWIALGADEETGGQRGARQMAEWFRQQNLHFDLILDEGGAVRDRYLGLSASVALVGVAEKGCMNLRLTVSDQAGHASTPPRMSVPGRLAEAVCRLEQKRTPALLNPTLKTYLTSTAVMQPRWDRLLIANLPYSRPLLQWYMGRNPEKNAMIRTTFAPTMLSSGDVPNVLPAEASAVINCRIAPGNSCDEVLTYVRELLQDLHITVDVLLEKEPSPVSDHTSTPYQLLEQAIHDVFGRIPVVPTVLSASTDGAHYTGLSDRIYRFMPFLLDGREAGRMHGADERVAVEDMGRAVLFYTQLIRALAEY